METKTSWLAKKKETWWYHSIISSFQNNCMLSVVLKISEGCRQEQKQDPVGSLALQLQCSSFLPRKTTNLFLVLSLSLFFSPHVFLSCCFFNILCGDANDTAGRSRTSVTGLLALFVPALAEIIGTGVDDDGSLLCETIHVSLSCLDCVGGEGRGEGVRGRGEGCKTYS